MVCNARHCVHVALKMMYRISLLVLFHNSVWNLQVIVLFKKKKLVGSKGFF